MPFVRRPKALSKGSAIFTADFSARLRHNLSSILNSSALASLRARPTFARMDSPPSKDPLHGVTLKQLLMELVEEFGWAELAERVDIRCFRFDPSINSSLVFLRRTPWARAKVEEIYVQWKTRR